MCVCVFVSLCLSAYLYGAVMRATTSALMALCSSNSCAFFAALAACDNVDEEKDTEKEEEKEERCGEHAAATAAW